MSARYHLVSEYTLIGDPETVWLALVEVASWPRWWRWLSAVETVRPATGPDALGAVFRNDVRTPLGYSFTYFTEVVEVDRLRRIDLLSSGDLVGRGRFLLAEPVPGEVEVSFVWLVETPIQWMNVLAPIARPLFARAHQVLMADFGRGLAAASGSILVRVGHRALAPGRAGFYVMPTSFATSGVDTR